MYRYKHKCNLSVIYGVLSGCELSRLCLIYYIVFLIHNICLHNTVYNVYLYMKSSFPKCDKRQSKIWGCKCQCQVMTSWFGKELFINNSITYIHMWKALSKHNLLTWHWHCKPIFFRNGAYRVLAKSSSYNTLYITLYINIIHIMYSILSHWIKLVTFFSASIHISGSWFNFSLCRLFTPGFSACLINVSQHQLLEIKGKGLITGSDARNIKIVFGAILGRYFFMQLETLYFLNFWPFVIVFVLRF